MTRVLYINPNPRTMSLLPPVVSLFHAIFERHGIEMRYFDTTFYDVSDSFTNPDKVSQGTLSVKPVADGAFAERTVKTGMDTLLADLRGVARDFAPDVVMMSALESTAGFARTMLAALREFGLPHVLGGVFATFAPEVAIRFPEIDVLCVGEGEEIIAPLAERLKAGLPLDDLPNLWWRGPDGAIVKTPRARPVDLDKNPRFTFAPWDDSRCYRPMAGRIWRMFPVETHRGCSFRCTFCNSPLQDDMYREETGQRYLRQKSLDKVFEDITYFAEDCRAEYLFFWADNFFLYSKAQIDTFCEFYKQYRIPFFVQSYPTSLDEYKLARLAEVGLTRVVLGVEHGNERFRREVIRRNYRNDAAIEKVRLLKKYGIQSSCNNIVGFPGETPELHWDTVRLNRAMAPDNAGISIFTPFMGTPLREISLARGWLKDPDLLAPTNNDYSVLDMPDFPAELIAGKARTFALYLRFPEERWPDIARAEALTPEGDRALAALSKEYLETWGEALA